METQSDRSWPKRYAADQIVLMLQEAGIQLAKGLNLDQVFPNLGFSTQSYYYADVKNTAA